MARIHFEEKKTLIRKQACFAQFTEDELNELSTLFVERRFFAGDTIVTEGEFVDSVYLIVKGYAEVQHARVINGNLQIEHLAKLGPESAIGLNESGFYSISGVRTATVVAQTNMLTLRLSVAAFHGFALMHSHVNQVIRNYASRILT